MKGKEWKCEEAGGTKTTPRKVSQKRLHLGGRRQGRSLACDSPSRGDHGGLRVMEKRPSDRRSPGRNPGPQGAFEVSMINVSCNSH